MKKREYNNYLTVRPVDGMTLDLSGMPVVKSVDVRKINNRNIKIKNFKNLKSNSDKENTIIDMFNYDEDLKRFWNDPLRYVAKFEGLLAVATPDYSVYPKMSAYEISHNIFMNRWIGALWQLCGLDVIVTVSWATKETYDICFSGIEENSVVLISTIGVKKRKKQFLEGFEELKRRKNPSLFIVIGDIFEEMEGNFVICQLKETFSQRKQYEQLSFFDNKMIQKEKGGVKYGW